VLKQFPPLVSQLFGHAVTTGGVLAILLNLVLPSEPRAVALPQGETAGGQ